MSEKTIVFSKKELHIALKLICELDNKYCRKMVFQKGLSAKEFAKKRVIEKLYDWVDEKIKN